MFVVKNIKYVAFKTKKNIKYVAFSIKYVAFSWLIECIIY